MDLCPQQDDATECLYEHCPFYHEGRRDRVLDDVPALSCFLKFPRTRIISFQTGYYEK